MLESTQINHFLCYHHRPSWESHPLASYIHLCQKVYFPFPSINALYDQDVLSVSCTQQKWVSHLKSQLACPSAAGTSPWQTRAERLHNITNLIQVKKKKPCSVLKICCLAHSGKYLSHIRWQNQINFSPILEQKFWNWGIHNHISTKF